MIPTKWYVGLDAVMRYLHINFNVNKSQEFLLNFRRLFNVFFDDDAARPTSSRRRNVVFFSTTQGIWLRRPVDVFFDDVVHYVAYLVRLETVSRPTRRRDWDHNPVQSTADLCFHTHNYFTKHGMDNVRWRGASPCAELWVIKHSISLCYQYSVFQ